MALESVLHFIYLVILGMGGNTENTSCNTLHVPHILSKMICTSSAAAILYLVHLNAIQFQNCVKKWFKTDQHFSLSAGLPVGKPMCKSTNDFLCKITGFEFVFSHLIIFSSLRQDFKCASFCSEQITFTCLRKRKLLLFKDFTGAII